MLRAVSHLVIASADVPGITAFFRDAFEVAPAFANDLFADFVLPSGFRVAFFAPVGSTANTFDVHGERRHMAIGITVDDVDRAHARVTAMGTCAVSGPPRDHPWGERSFLLTDPDGNRWEVTQSPSPSGMLVDRWAGGSMSEPVRERTFAIAPARSKDETAAVAALLRDYAASIDIDLSYQHFEEELANLPGEYAPPAGDLLLARAASGTPLGCVAVRPLPSPGCCEMKRLYVSPLARGLGLGRALAETIIARAADLGYSEMRLDTLQSMHAAIALYRDLGFTSMPPYYAPVPEGTVFMRCPLGGRSELLTNP